MAFLRIRAAPDRFWPVAVIPVPALSFELRLSVRDLCSRPTLRSDNAAAMELRPLYQRVGPLPATGSGRSALQRDNISELRSAKLLAAVAPGQERRESGTGFAG